MSDRNALCCWFILVADPNQLQKDVVSFQNVLLRKITPSKLFTLIHIDLHVLR